MSTKKTDWKQSQNQKQLSIGNVSSHEEEYPFPNEFNQLIADMSMKELNELMNPIQKRFAESLWEAENYGGSIEKCKKRLTEIHGSNWREITSIKEHMKNKKEYYEMVLLIDYKKQRDVHENSANINKD